MMCERAAERVERVDVVEDVAERVAAWAEVASAASRAEGCDAGAICRLMAAHLRGEAERLERALPEAERAGRP